MEKIKILIVEDTPHEGEELKRILSTQHYQVVGVAATHKDALQLFYNNQVDLVIIDIFLDGVPDGIAFAESINVVPGASRPFVFLTSSTDRKIFERAKLTRPFNYLLKPFNELEVLYAIEMAIEKFYGQVDTFHNEEAGTVVGEKNLFIKKGRSLKKVQKADILYIEVEERYCNVITDTDKFLIMISLKKVLELLGKRFVRTHRNYLINLDHIEEVIPADNLIIIQGAHQIPLSDKYKEFLKKVRTLK